jgi:hypothetical protein
MSRGWLLNRGLKNRFHGVLCAGFNYQKYSNLPENYETELMTEIKLNESNNHRISDEIYNLETARKFHPSPEE